VCDLQLYLQETVKFNLQQAMKAQRGSRGIYLLFLQPRRWVGWVVNATPRPLYPREGDSVQDGRGKSRLCRDSIPGPSSPYLFAVPTELSWPAQSASALLNYEMYQSYYHFLVAMKLGREIMRHVAGCSSLDGKRNKVFDKNSAWAQWKRN
jgi:hypothetical protein